MPSSAHSRLPSFPTRRSSDLAAEYANGTRFFAYRALKRRLSCRELRVASRDTQIAAAHLSAPASGLSAQQAAKALSLSRAVGARSEERRVGRESGTRWARDSG